MVRAEVAVVDEAEAETIEAEVVAEFCVTDSGGFEPPVGLC